MYTQNKALLGLRMASCDTGQLESNTKYCGRMFGRGGARRFELLIGEAKV